jgi:cytochrome c553
MSKLAKRLVLSTGTASFLLILVLVSARGQQPQGPDPERAFGFGDTNLDGKLSLEEFLELPRNAPGKKAAAKKGGFLREPIFRQLDTDRDGFLTFPEFRKLGQFQQGAGGGGFGKGGMAKNKAAARSTAARPKTNSPPRAIVDRPITPDQLKFFETKIRPVLMTSCAKCHASNAEKIKGSLLVDSREALRKGGDTGPAVVPGNLEESLLITAIGYKDESLQMPPKTKLSEEVIADFETWVKMGAPDPRDGTGGLAMTTKLVDVERGRQFWSFQPPRSVSPPKVKNESWPKSDIDRFLLSALETKGLKPVADADRYILIRRATFDLTGLPPTPEEIETFVNDSSSDAFAKVVDRLLASPRFGERWGRHWLDVARFAESSGKANMIYPQAWRYRDWVIAAFNADKPYDQFVKEQIAGDLLPRSNPQRQAEGVIATGFLAIGSKIHNTQNRKQFLVDMADEQIDVSGQAFLGLTIACARCHDHKFDPIPQRDYYALSGIFQSTQTCYGTLPGLVQNANPSPLIELPADSHAPSAVPKLPADRRAPLEAQLAELIKTRDSLTPEENFSPKGFQTRTRLAMLRFRLASYQPDGTARTYAMGVRERFEPIDSPLYARGELDQPGELVPRGLVQVVCQETPATISSGSGRLELAEWLASRQNPLTARVMVNRIWLHLFGRGLVPSPDNFGASGQPPSHPELLDALAVSFMDQSWSVKKVIRHIVLSHAYQLSSGYDARNFEVDPDNTLVWHMTKKRLEAEAIRDAVLSVSGKLILEPPVGSAVAQAGEGIAGPFRNFNQDGREMHRAVYLPVVRDQLPESLTLFDFADPSLATGERSSTSGPSQALYLMNNPFVIRQAESAADRLRMVEDDDDRVTTATLRFLGRKPTDGEQARARQFLAKFSGAEHPGSASDRAAWTAFCQALYASAEFRFLD